MKKSLFISLCLMAGVLASCSKSMDDFPEPQQPHYDYPAGYQTGKTYTAIATAKYLQTGSNYSNGFHYLKVSENLCIADINNSLSVSGRVYCQFRLLDKKPISGIFWAEIDWYENVELGDNGLMVGGPPNTYINIHDDGLDVIDDWMTSQEDGFLTIHYSAWFGNSNVWHHLALTPDDKDNPLVLTLRHDAKGDMPLEKTDALIYFDINDRSQYIDEEHYYITVKWTTCAGQPAEKKFLFKGRED